MKRVLVICPTMYEWEEIYKINKSHDIEISTKEFNEHALTQLLYGNTIRNTQKIQSPQAYMSDIVEFCKNNKINGVLSASDYPGCVFASIVAHMLNLPGPHPSTLLACQNKYQSRLAQAQFVPEFTPRFIKFDPYTMDVQELIDLLPLYIKPIKSRISILAHYIDTSEQLDKIKNMRIAPSFAHYFNWFLKHYSSFDLDGHCFIAEQALSGVQTTVEGFVFCGEVTILGIIDSVMYPGTQSFEQFIYPSRLSLSICEKMEHISKTFISAIGYDNGFFNIEYMYNQETEMLHIIEVNSRICSQFFDLYEKVDGFNSYNVLIDIATGTRPVLPRKKGAFSCSGILVLRVFTDARVKKIPSKREKEHFYNTFPYGKFHSFVTPEQNLSDNPQDALSYRYGLIHLGGQSYEDLQEKLYQAKTMLTFNFEEIYSL